MLHLHDVLRSGNRFLRLLGRTFPVKCDVKRFKNRLLGPAATLASFPSRLCQRDQLSSYLFHLRPEEIMQSNTDAEEWRLEVERVAPQLKVIFSITFSMPFKFNLFLLL